MPALFPRRRSATGFAVFTQNLVREHLVEESMAAHTPVKEFLGCAEAGEVYLLDMPWFKKHWPEDVQMRCVVLQHIHTHITHAFLLDFENAHGIKTLSTAYF